MFANIKAYVVTNRKSLTEKAIVVGATLATVAIVAAVVKFGLDKAAAQEVVETVVETTQEIVADVPETL